MSGTPAKQVDVTHQIQQAIVSGDFSVTVNNDLADQDPAHGTKKTLELKYTLNGTLITRSLPENIRYDLNLQLETVSQLETEEHDETIDESKGNSRALSCNGAGRYRCKFLIISDWLLFSDLRLLTEQSVDGVTI